MPGHLFGRFQPLSGLDDLFRGKGAQGAVERDGPHQAVERHNPPGPQNRPHWWQRAELPAPGQLQRLAAGGPGNDFHPALGAGTQRLDDVRVGAEHRKIFRRLGEVSEQGKILIEMALGEQFGKQFITLWGFGQDDEGSDE